VKGTVVMGICSDCVHNLGQLAANGFIKWTK